MAIRHLVLMRLQPGVFTPDALKDYRDTFAALKAALPEDVLDARVYTNVVDRPQNMTVMIEMLLASPASLPRYLQHPLHQGIGKRYNPYVEAIASFDCEVKRPGKNPGDPACRSDRRGDRRQKGHRRDPFPIGASGARAHAPS